MTSRHLTSKAGPKLIELVKSDARSHYGDFKRNLMEHLTMKHKLLSIPTKVPWNVGSVGGERSYVMLGSLAKLERALMKWSMNELVSKHNFTPVVVPNIVYDHVVENCGFPTKSARTQVYKISATNEESILDKEATLADSENKTHSCLAGTSEFALTSIHIGDTIPSEELPKRYCALSRCYRAETSSTSGEWGVYRVHYFNKVEMVALTMPDKSSTVHDEFLDIQRDLYKKLNLQFQTLEMPEDDLGLSAKKKYDIEAWMEGRQRYGEISSTSNCQDYQSSRLNIKFSEMAQCNDQLELKSGFVHTINGTACSSVRTLIALIEQHQTEDGEVHIPPALNPYMDGIKTIPTPDDKRLLDDLDLNLEKTATD